MTQAEHPEDEQRTEEQEPETPAEPSGEAGPQAAEAEAAPAPPAGEAEAVPAPPGGEAEAVPAPPAGEAEAVPAPPAGEAEAAPAPPAGEAEAALEPPAGQAEAEAAPEPPAPSTSTPPAEPELGEEEEAELAPRQRPDIPGADLIPDIIPEGEEFLDAEARAAAEAEAEAAAARQDDESEDETQPIADAAIDLAAGARYTSTGKRKSSVARVMLKPGTGSYAINGKELNSYFPRETLQRIIRQPLETVGYESRMDVVARMHGGGVSSQAGALRHGISRALIVADPNLRGELKRRGFLTRDPRVKERKKAGLKKARKRPQFSKR